MNEDDVRAHYDRLEREGVPVIRPAWLGPSQTPTPCAPQASVATLATPEDKRLEAEVEAGITAFLALDGWRGLKTDPVSDKSRGKGFGELGMADYLYIRYAVRVSLPPDFWHVADAEVLWIEHKRPHGSRIAQNQHDWHKIERERGALTLKAGEDFTPTVVGFREWYEKSGLMRRRTTELPFHPPAEDLLAAEAEERER